MSDEEVEEFGTPDKGWISVNTGLIVCPLCHSDRYSAFSSFTEFEFYCGNCRRYFNVWEPDAEYTGDAMTRLVGYGACSS